MAPEQSKATPGPWNYEFGHEMQSGVRYWQVHNGQDAVCSNQFCYAALGDEAISEANARLIAAAPEMLATLKETIDVLSSRYQNLSNGNWDDGELQLLAQQIEAAIAKAEGRQP